MENEASSVRSQKLPMDIDRSTFLHLTALQALQSLCFCLPQVLGAKPVFTVGKQNKESTARPSLCFILLGE